VPSIAVISLKGGVGKSTVVLGLAGAAWKRGLRTLVIDLDPQANATAALDVTPIYTTNDVLADAREGIAAEAIRVSGWGPHIEVLGAERALEHRNVPEGRASTLRLRIALTGVVDNYDLVLIDCPPSLGELTRNALAAAQLALVVTEPSFFALQGAAQAIGAIEVVRSAANLGLQTAGVVVNRVRPNTAEHVFRLAELRTVYGDLVLDPTVPERTALSQAQGACLPIQAWHSAGAQQAADVFDDLLDTMLIRGREVSETAAIGRALAFGDRK